jgi:hypothetical protein
VDQPIVRDDVARYYARQIAVDLAHLPVVKEALRNFLTDTGHQIQIESEDADDGLGLALLDLSYDDDVIRTELRRELEECLRDAAGATVAGGADQPPHEPLDIVLMAVRCAFAREMGGLTPIVGKNRDLDTGFPHVGGGADGGPEAVGEAPRALAGLRETEHGRGVLVGLPDSRFYPHWWLAGGYNAEPGALIRPVSAWVADYEAPSDPLAGHSTFAAGMILQQAGGARIEVADVLGDNVQGSTWKAAKALVRLADSGVTLINVSFGCHTADKAPPLVMSRAIERLGRDVVVVAASGNHGNNAEHCALHQHCPGPTDPIWPGAQAGVITVGASVGLDEPEVAADFTPKAGWVKLLAPGVAVTSTYLDETVGSVAKSFPTGFATWRGSSFAAATVTGAIAKRMRPDRVDAREALGLLLAEIPEPGQAPHGPQSDPRANDPGIRHFTR